MGKTLIIGIIMLFLSTMCLHAMVSEGKHGLVSPTTDQMDNNDEIITFISGSHYGLITNKWGFIRDVDIFAGMGGTGLEIKGRMQYTLESFHYLTVQYIHAPHFLGFSIPTGPPYGIVIGIAIGNIEWS